MSWRRFHFLLLHRDDDEREPGEGSGLARAVAAYARWIERHHLRLMVVALLVGLVAAGLAISLPLRTEFSWLLPDEEPSVVALRQLTARKPSSAVIEIGIASPSPD